MISPTTLNSLQRKTPDEEAVVGACHDCEPSKLELFGMDLKDEGGRKFGGLIVGGKLGCWGKLLLSRGRSTH